MEEQAKVTSGYVVAKTQSGGEASARLGTTIRRLNNVGGESRYYSYRHGCGCSGGNTEYGL